MDGLNAVPSPLLQEANRRLHQLRTQAQRKTNAPLCIKKGDEMSVLGIADVPVTSIPDHLGWGSEALTAVIRQQQPVCDDHSAWISRLAKTTQIGATASVSNQPSTKNPVVKLYPHIGLGMLRQEKATSGRLWLMLHHLDVAGSG